MAGERNGSGRQRRGGPGREVVRGGKNGGKSRRGPGPQGRSSGKAPQPPRDNPVADPRELRLYGINACLAFLANRRERVIRGYFTEAVGRRHFAPLMKWLAQQRLAYHLVTEAELERITGSAHHQGVCLLVRGEEPRAAGDWLREHRQAKRGCVLALENVGNPHNLGAILRTAAHFGVAAVLVPDSRMLAGGAAVRTAEGGAEYVEVLDAPEFARSVQQFREAGWKLLTTSSHRGEDLYEAKLPAKCLLLFGEESTGVTPDMMAAGDACVRIPGTGKVESLNVSVATGVLLGEWYRRWSAPARPLSQ